MFKRLGSVIKNFKRRHFEKQVAIQLARFDEMHRYEERGHGGLCINGNLVHEFTYLLRYISEGQFQSMEDHHAIHSNIVQLRAHFSHELAKPLMREEDVFGVGRATAEANLQNLRRICEVISKRMELLAEISNQRGNQLGISDRI
ncbi:hypothetical protein [Pseudoduganella aquatica]|uniref:hypothetical protein n=1 Tax=Pseudoduganella aquatica TaxID=2660641 RepID=UPI001E47B0F8|nr:hypothetical protein [Pseudoduganella aquatica]